MLHDCTTNGLLNEESVVVFGDIHGRLDLLNEHLEQVAGYGCQLIFLGDYIDRGPDGIGVLKRVIELVKFPTFCGFSKVTALLGNHEHMALLAAATGAYSDMQLWLQNGGRMEEFPAIKNDYQEWLSNLPTLYKHDKKVFFKGAERELVCTHGSIDPSRPLEAQDVNTLVWGRAERGYDTDTLVVNGHTPVDTPKWYTTTTGDVLRIDTGAYYTDVLTAVIFQEVP
jgi:serine/threonine protein phosphatase 1